MTMTRTEALEILADADEALFASYEIDFPEDQYDQAFQSRKAAMRRAIKASIAEAEAVLAATGTEPTA